MSQSMICNAIRSKNVIRFYYTGDDEHGYRTVEPHMVARNVKNHLCLNGWFLGGASESDVGQGWRTYLMSEISRLDVLPTTFSTPRPGYRRDGGKSFHNVQCAL